MTLQEFIERTGFNPGEAYYHARIEEKYLESNLDKDAFCKQWKKNAGIQNAYNYYVSIANIENKLRSDAEIELKQTKSQLEDVKQKLFESNRANEALNEAGCRDHDEKIALMRRLIEVSERYSSSELRDIIIETLGFKDYIAFKLENGMAIWEADKQAIIENLK